MGAIGRRRLLKLISSCVSESGLAPVPETKHVLYYQRREGLVLMLGVEFSRLYNEHFTASYYLSPTFTFALAHRDYPDEAHVRIGGLLQCSERRRLLADRYNEPGVVDAWWETFTQDSVSRFCETVKLTIDRFVDQPGLVQAITTSKDAASHRAIVMRVASLAAELLDQPEPELHHQPTKHLKAVPAAYYWAAEIVGVEAHPEWAWPAYVRQLAVDAWRTAIVESAE